MHAHTHRIIEDGSWKRTNGIYGYRNLYGPASLDDLGIRAVGQQEPKQKGKEMNMETPAYGEWHRVGRRILKGADTGSMSATIEELMEDYELTPKPKPLGIEEIKPGMLVRIKVTNKRGEFRHNDDMIRCVMEVDHIVEILRASATSGFTKGEVQNYRLEEIKVWSVNA